MFRKKNMSVFTAFLLLFSCIFSVPFIVSAASSDDIPEWDGTKDYSWFDDEETEFHISTPSQFAGLSSLVNSGRSMEGKTIFLENDISFSDLSLNPIGPTLAKCFKGTFDGQNHILYNINNLQIIQSGDGCGLFGNSSGEIRNLIIDKSCSFHAPSSSFIYMGVICGYNNGKIENCINYSPVTCSKSDRGFLGMGAICGKNDGGIIENCNNIGSVSLSASRYDTTSTTSKEYEFSLGAICGINNNGTISGCLNHAMVSFNNNVDVQNLKYLNTVSVKHKYYFNIGGICGFSNTMIKDSQNKGDVLVQTSGGIDIYKINTDYELQIWYYLYTGGICGVGSAYQCSNSGQIVAKQKDSYNTAGGIVCKKNATCSNCVNYGSVIGYGIGEKSENSYNIGSCTAEGIVYYGNAIYYLNSTTAPTAGSAIAKSDANMRKPEFAEALGDAFVYVEGDYPKLAWETVRYNASFPDDSITMTMYNQQKQLKPTTTYQGTITYLSTDASVATVDSKGIVTAVSEGTAQIYALCGLARAECNVTVKYDYHNYYLKPTKLAINVGETADLSIISKSTEQPADIKAVTYTSSNQEIATISNTGTVKAIAEGQCTITAELLGGKLTCTVTVTKPAETEPINKDPVLNVSELKVDKGKSSELSVQNYSGTVTWISADTTIATVKANSDTLSASITGLKKGTATIYAMLSNGKALTCTVTVEEGTPTSGDITGDGKFTVLDAIALQKYLICEDVTLKDWKAGDFNNDNALTAIDLTLMKRALLNP